MLSFIIIDWFDYSCLLSGSSDYGMYGGGFGDSHTKSRMSCYSADAVIAKLNEKLDMLSQLEGGLRAGRNNR